MAEEPIGEEVNARKGEDNYQSSFNDAKLTFEAFLDQVLETAKRSSDVGVQVNTVALQALQNAVETANMVGKNAVINMDAATKQQIQHRDIAVNKQWNIEPSESASQVEILKAVGMDSATIAGIQAAFVKAISDALGKTDVA